MTECIDCFRRRLNVTECIDCLRNIDKRWLDGLHAALVPMERVWMCCLFSESRWSVTERIASSPGASETFLNVLPVFEELTKRDWIEACTDQIIWAWFVNKTPALSCACSVIDRLNGFCLQLDYSLEQTLAAYWPITAASLITSTDFQPAHNTTRKHDWLPAWIEFSEPDDLLGVFSLWLILWLLSPLLIRAWDWCSTLLTEVH